MIAVFQIQKYREKAEWGGELFYFKEKQGPIGPHRSVGSAQDLRTGIHWFHHGLGQYFFPWIDDSHYDRIHYTITLLLLSIVSTMVMYKNSQWHGKNIVRSTG